MYNRPLILIGGLALILARPVAAADCTTDKALCPENGRFRVELSGKESGTAKPARTHTHSPAITTTPRGAICTCRIHVDSECQSRRFLPNEIHFSAGGSDRWRYFLGFSDSITSGQGGVPDGRWDSGVSNSGDTRTFPRAGTFYYFCRAHGETRVVVVNP